MNRANRGNRLFTTRFSVTLTTDVLILAPHASAAKRQLAADTEEVIALLRQMIRPDVLPKAQVAQVASRGFVSAFASDERWTERVFHPGTQHLPLLGGSLTWEQLCDACQVPHQEPHQEPAQGTPSARPVGDKSKPSGKEVPSENVLSPELEARRIIKEVSHLSHPAILQEVMQKLALTEPKLLCDIIEAAEKALSRRVSVLGAIRDGEYGKRFLYDYTLDAKTGEGR